jgi:hypothetical protein
MQKEGTQGLLCHRAWAWDQMDPTSDSSLLFLHTNVKLCDVRNIRSSQWFRLFVRTQISRACHDHYYPATGDSGVHFTYTHTPERDSLPLPRQTNPKKVIMTINRDNHNKVQKLKNNICNFMFGFSDSFQLRNHVIRKILFLSYVFAFLTPHILYILMVLRDRDTSILVKVYLHNLLMQKLPVLIRCQQNCMTAPCHSNFSLSSRAYLTERW